MDNVISFKKILEDTFNKRKEAAAILEEAEKSGYITEECITYALQFMTTEELKYIINSIKLLLREYKKCR